MKYEEVYGKDYVFVDVRSPKEFEEATIPNAVNIPLLYDDEREMIGILYKKDKEKALEKGIEVVGDKLGEIINKFSEFRNKRLIVFCWRGGMRSKSIVFLLKKIGFDAEQLEGGYKSYRKFVREKLENYEIKSKLIVICGLTGAGKTKLIEKLENGMDLEGLAQHRGSLFGGIGLKPRSQKMFESLLFERIEELKDSECIFIENESSKIGDVFIPNFLFSAMKKGVKVKLDIDFEGRVRNIVEEYGKLDKDCLKEAIGKLTGFLGRRKIELLIGLLDKGDVEEIARILLKDYYDVVYSGKDLKCDYVVKNEDEFNNLFRD